MSSAPTPASPHLGAQQTPSFRKDLLGIPDSTASPIDSTLIIIDAQNEYAEGKLKVSNIDTSRPAISDLLNKYRDAKGSVVHIRHQTPEGAPVFTQGTKLADEFQELAPKEGEEIIVKAKPGAFDGTELGKHLDGLGDRGKKVVLCGYMAHVCVSTTAREAFQRGHEVVLAGDAIGDRDIPGALGGEVTKMSLLELSDVFGTVVKTADIK